MKDRNNRVVSTFGVLVDTLAESLVVLFDGMRHAIEHANPSLFGLVATLLPFALPLPVAFMTSHSAQEFFGWDAWAANVLGFGLEGLGLLVWVRLVDAIIEKVEHSQNFLWSVAIAYEGLLIAINVVLTLREGAGWLYALTLFLICLLPALSAAMYGLHRRENAKVLADERAEYRKYEQRKERREDRKIKDGGLTMVPLNLDVPFGEGRAKIKKSCESCGREFVTTYPNKRTCSDACRKRLSRDRHGTSADKSRMSRD